MTMSTQPRKFDLEDRTKNFSKRVRIFVHKLPFSIANKEDSKQIIRSSGSVGANYIEANESITRRDCIHRINICRKEAKESNYWLSMFETNDEALQKELSFLLQESKELEKS